MRERNCRTCLEVRACAALDLMGEKRMILCQHFRMRPYWSKAERAGLRAMGKAVAHRDRKVYRGTPFICWAIAAFVRAAIAAKRRTP
jgi:hypothetical protein